MCSEPSVTPSSTALGLFQTAPRSHNEVTPQPAGLFPAVRAYIYLHSRRGPGPKSKRSSQAPSGRAGSANCWAARGEDGPQVALPDSGREGPRGSARGSGEAGTARGACPAPRGRGAQAAGNRCRQPPALRGGGSAAPPDPRRSGSPDLRPPRSEARNPFGRDGSAQSGARGAVPYRTAYTPHRAGSRRPPQSSAPAQPPPLPRHPLPPAAPRSRACLGYATAAAGGLRGPRRAGAAGQGRAARGSVRAAAATGRAPVSEARPSPPLPARLRSARTAR